MSLNNLERTGARFSSERRLLLSETATGRKTGRSLAVSPPDAERRHRAEGTECSGSIGYDRAQFSREELVVSARFVGA